METLAAHHSQKKTRYINIIHESLKEKRGFLKRETKRGYCMKARNWLSKVIINMKGGFKKSLVAKTWSQYV